MIVQTCQAYVPAKRSLAVAIAKDPSIDLVAGRDLGLPSDGDGTGSLPSSAGHAFAPVTSGPLLALARDKVIGQRIAFANTGLAMLDKTLPLTGLNLPVGTDAVFEIVGVALSTVDTYHEFTRQDRSYLHQGLSLANTMSSLTKALSPVIPALQPYQGAIEGIGLILKLVKTGGELVRGEDEYRVLQLTMRR
jgi:hypothetical protein